MRALWVRCSINLQETISHRSRGQRGCVESETGSRDMQTENAGWPEQGNKASTLQSRRPTPLEPKSRIGEDVAAALMRELVASNAPAGTFLPPEKDLAAKYQVGRWAIREALSLLANTGVVKVHHGRGTTVERESNWNVLSPLVMSALEESDHYAKVTDDLFEVRAVLEDYAARVAAARATAAEREALSSKARAIVAIAENPALDTGAFLEADRDFHDFLATISGNSALRQIIREVHVHSPSTWTDVELEREDRLRSAYGHARIASAIERGDIEEARAAMAAHMDRVRTEQKLGGAR